MARSVTYDRGFDDEMAKHRATAAGPSRIDDVVDGAEWVIANDPYRHEMIADTAWRAVPTDPVDELPGFLIAYEITSDGQICMKALIPRPDPDADST